jgi:hypothetical protein
MEAYGDYLIVAMEALADRGGALRVFRVYHGDGGQWLNTNDGDPGAQWNPDDSFAFVARKQRIPI